MVSPIEVIMNATAKIHVTLDRAEAALRPDIMPSPPPPPPRPSPPPSER